MPHPILLSSLDYLRPQDPRTGLGTASITAALRDASVSVSVIGDAVNRPGFTVPDHIVRVDEALAAAGPDAIVGLGGFVWNEAGTQQLSRHLNERGVTVVLGGPQVSYTSVGRLESRYPHVDVFVRGHGEAAMIDAALGRLEEGRNGVHLAGEEDLGVHAALDLAALPSPHLDGTLPPQPFVRWETQRGCPFRCSFCQHRQAGKKLSRPHFSMTRVADELAHFAQSGVRRIAVLDPIFHANDARAIAVLQCAKRVGLTATLSLQCRFELLSDAFLDALEGLNYELEFGLQTAVLAEGRAVRRPLNHKMAVAAIAKLHARGIPFEVSLIYGLPHQTLESFQTSVQWCQDQGVTSLKAWPLMVLPGTALDEQRAQYGIEEVTEHGITYVAKTHTMSRADQREMAAIAQALNHRPAKDAA